MILTSGTKVDKPPDVAVGEDSIGAGFVVGWSEPGLRWTLSVHQQLNGPLRPGGKYVIFKVNIKLQSCEFEQWIKLTNITCSWWGAVAGSWRSCTFSEISKSWFTYFCFVVVILIHVFLSPWLHSLTHCLLECWGCKTPNTWWTDIGKFSTNVR